MGSEFPGRGGERGPRAPIARAVVVGLGKSGLSAVRLLRSRGASVRVEERRTLSELGALNPVLREPEVVLSCGRPLALERLVDGDLVVVSPGVPWNLPALVAARAAGLEVIGEAELAWRFLSHDRPLVGITGTNGKSTTTALVGALFAEAGLSAFVGGNLGTALSEAALLSPAPGAYVVEYSSYQLEGIADTRVTAAAILNLTPDHLDRYASMDAYAEAKARIFEKQQPGDVAVLNLDDAPSFRLGASAHVPLHAFCLDPLATGEAHALAVLARPCPAGFEVLSRGSASLRFKVANRSLRGAHNLQNAMAAALLALPSGVGADAVQRGLDAFPGLPHRLEFVRNLKGVEWVNDSKATNVDSSVTALRAFEGQRIWLIAGGKGKGAPYGPLKAAAIQKVAGVLTVGQDAHSIEKEFGDVFAVHSCETLERAVSRARELASEGDVVLLSPACASFDQFRSFEDRGETFKRLVMAL